MSELQISMKSQVFVCYNGAPDDLINIQKSVQISDKFRDVFNLVKHQRCGFRDNNQPKKVQLEMLDIFEIYCCAHLIYCQAYFFPKYDEKCWKKGDSKNYISQCCRMTWLQCHTKRSGKALWISKLYFDPCCFLESATALKWKPHWQKFGNFLSRKLLIYKFVVLVLLSVGSFTTDPSGGW